MRGKKHEYNPFDSSFVRPEIQGLLEASKKTGILSIGRDGGEAENFIVSATDLGLVVLSVGEVIYNYQVQICSFYFSC